MTTQENMAARWFAPRLGRKLQERYPKKIKRFYLDSYSTREIVEILNLQRYWPHAALNTLINAINYALKGYRGQDSAVRIKRYKGLLRAKEMDEARKKIQQRVASERAAKRWNTKTWSDDEIAYARELVEDPCYKIVNGRHRGQRNLSKIAVELNRVFHGCKPIRNANRVRLALYRYKDD